MNLSSEFKRINYSKPKNYLDEYINNSDSLIIRNLSKFDIENTELLMSIAEFRNIYNYAFRNRFVANLKSTHEWLSNDFFVNNKRILFLIFDSSNKLLAHIGLFIRNNNYLEIDNVIKNTKNNEFKMYEVLEGVESFSIKKFNVKSFGLKVLESNNRALSFYIQNGYSVVYRKNQKLFCKEGVEVLSDTHDKNYDDRLLILEKNIE